MRQDQIANYFAAADLVVLPYRAFMCASGVMSLVFSYTKPFIISEQLTPMLASSDFQQALDKTGLKAKDISFTLDNKSLLAVTEKVLENGFKS